MKTKGKKKDIWQEFSERILKQAEVLPKGEGWLTIDEMAERLGLRRTGVQTLIKRTKGQLERFQGVALSSNGRMLPKTWYRPRQGAAKGT